MLSFLAPVFLAGAAAAAVPIVLHLLRRQPESRVRFAAVRLLRRAPVEQTETRRLRELLLLALRIAALVLLALAFARPYLESGGAAASGITIVALDTSYSLSAPAQVERARQLAREAITRAPSSDLVGVVTFADAAGIAAKPSADRTLAISAVNRAAPGYGATRYRAAFGAAVRAIGGGRGTIVVVTDLQETGWDAGERASVPDSVRVEIADVGAPPQNLAVVALKPAGDRLVALVRNSAPRPRDARVRLTLDGRAAGDATIPIGAHASAEVTFGSVGRAETAAVAVDDPDGLQADDVRHAVLVHANPSTLLVVTANGDLAREAFYVQHALAAGAGGAARFQLAGVSAARLASGKDELASASAVLLLSTRGLDRRGRAALAAHVRGGGGVLIAAGPDVDGDVVADVLGRDTVLRVGAAVGQPDALTLAPADVRHPVFSAFGPNAASLGLAKFRRVAPVAGSGCQTLARFTSGEPALLDCAVGDGRALVIASDLGNRWNDFPIHATFVPFLQQAVRYLAGANPQTDEYLVGDAPAGVAAAPGIVTLAGTSRDRVSRPRLVAVNVDPHEADVARMSADEFQAAVTRLRDAGAPQASVEGPGREDRQRLWQYLLALMIATLAVEGVVARRTT